MSMDEKIVFSLEEIQEIATISQSLKEELKDSMLPDDELALREVIKSTIESGKLHRDIFGLNPVLVGFQTAELAVREIGLKRDGVIATLMYSCVINNKLAALT